MDKSGELRLPPDRKRNSGSVLLAPNLATQASKVVKCFLDSSRRSPGTPEVGTIDLSGNRFQYRGKLSRCQGVQMAGHQGQAQPQLIVTAQGSDGPPDFCWLQTIITGESPEMPQDINQRQKGVLSVRLERKWRSRWRSSSSVATSSIRRRWRFSCRRSPQRWAGWSSSAASSWRTWRRPVLHLAGKVVLGRGHVVAPGHAG